jgi:hypothetical protein
LTRSPDEALLLKTTRTIKKGNLLTVYEALIHPSCFPCPDLVINSWRRAECGERTVGEDGYVQDSEIEETRRKKRVDAQEKIEAGGLWPREWPPGLGVFVSLIKRCREMTSSSVWKRGPHLDGQLGGWRAGAVFGLEQGPQRE